MLYQDIDIGENSLSYKITQFTTSNSLNINTTQENDFTHLTINDESPYDRLAGYWSFDENFSNYGNITYASING